MYINNLKYVCFIIIYSISFFIRNIYININNKEIIDIDNEFKDNFYERSNKFNGYISKLKPIALYYPEYNNISYYQYFNRILKEHDINKYKINKVINAQIKLAKEHNIYGFGIFYNLFNFNNISRITIDIFFMQKIFPYFLIWRNEEIDELNTEILIILINNIKKFLISDNYIKINGKPILSINNPVIIQNRIKIILTLRQLSNNIIGKLFILYPFKGKYSNPIFIKVFDGAYDLSNIDLYDEKIKRRNILYYSGFIYKNIILNKMNIKFKLFRTCYVNYYKFFDYKPEKLYIQNKIILQSEEYKYNLNNGFLFIDSWNDYFRGNYLEFDEKFGYSSINSFAKSILNLSYISNDFKLNYDNKNIKIAIHIHVFYEELFSVILRRLNFIPFKYDLFISTVTEEKKLIIEKYLLHSNHNTYEIKIFKNIGRDIYSLLTQMKSHIKYYKYICHLHTKKSMHNQLLGSNWSEYLYNNLIGNREIISNIIKDFEYNKKIGFIFPEPYYEIIKDVNYFDNINFALHKPNKKLINNILNKIFHKCIIGEKIIFPVGNMFWAKLKAIYQIFNIRLKYPDELNQTNATIMHALERIWLYLVKLNGYEYKMIFNHY